MPDEHKNIDTEVVAKAKRRFFTAEYKARILKEVQTCKADPGSIGALLRKEGLYSSHLTTWKKERDRQQLEALAPKKRGPKPKVMDEKDGKISELEKELSRWKARAERAELLCDVQKKVSSLLGIPLPPSDERP